MDELIGKLRIDVELINKVQKEARNVENSIKQLENTITRELQGVSKAFDESLGRATDKLGAQMEVTGNKTKKVTSATKEVAAATQGVSKELQFAAFQMFIIGMTMAQLAKQLSSLSSAFINFAKSAVNATANFKDVTEGLGMSMGLADDRLQVMEETLRNLSLIIPLPTDQMAKLAVAVSDAGIKGESSVIGMTASIAKLAVVFDTIPVEKLTTDVLSLVQTFNLSTGQIDNMASVLIKLNQQVGGTFDDYATALDTVASSNKNLKFEFNEMATILGALVPQYGSVSKATSALDGIMKGFSDNIDGIATTLGVSGDQLAKMLEQDAASVVIDYVEKLKGIGDQSKINQKAFEDFGKNGGQAMIELTGDLDKLKTLQQEVNGEFESGSAFQKEYQKNVQDLKSAWTQFQNTIGTLLQEIGNELLPYIIKGVQLLTRVGVTLIALWKGLSPEAKKVVLIVGAIVTVVGILATAAATLLAILLPLIVGFISLAAVLGGVGMAGLVVVGVLLLIVGAAIAVVAALAALLGMSFDFDLGNKIKGWLGLDKLSEEIKKAEQEVNDGMDNAATATEKGAKRMGKAIVDTSRLLHAWSNTFLGEYVYQFTKADWSLLDDVTDIAEQHFTLLEKAGKISSEQAVLGLQRVRGYLGQAISEMKDLGQISSETLKLIRNAVGPERANSILKEIQQGIKVNQLEEVIQDLSDQLEGLKANMKKEVDQIDQQVKSTEELYAGQLKPLEDSIAALEKSKKALEKQYKIEVKAYENRVEVAEDQLDIEKDQLEQVKEINDAEMAILEEQRDSSRERLDDALETVKELKDLRDKEVEAAQGMLDYARMNLEAAQNNLKKQQILGKDEFDANFRAALERVDASEDQVNLANDTYIRTKNAYDKEIDIAQNKADLEQTSLDAIEANIKTLKKIHDTEENYYSSRVKIAQDELESAKDALDIFKELYDDQKDALQEQIDAQQEVVDGIKEARDGIIDALEAEKNAVQAKYGEEIDIIEEKKTAAEATLKKEQDYLYTLQRLNDEYIKTINDRLQGMEKDIQSIDVQPQIDYGDTPAFNVEPIKIEMPDISFGNIKEKIKTLVNQMRDDLISFFFSLPTPYELGTQIGKWMKDSLNPKNMADFQGKLIDLMFSTSGLIALFKGMDWGQFWEDIKAELETKLQDATWEDIISTILNLLFPVDAFLSGVLDGLGITSDFEWDKDVRDPLIRKVSSIDWGGVVTSIFTSMGMAIPNALISASKWGLDIAAKVKDGIWSGITWLYDAGVGISQRVQWGVEVILNKGYTMGRDIIAKIKDGIWSGVSWGYDAAIGAKNEIQRGINKIVSSAWTWGRDFMANFKDGIWSGMQWVKDSINSLNSWIKKNLGHSVPSEGLLKDEKNWMPHMMQNLASGIRENIPLITMEMDKVSGILANGISGNQLLTSAGVGELNIAGAAAEFKAPTINQKQEQVIIQAGNVFATEGEMREFARSLENYRKIEAQRSGAEN